MVQPTRSAKPGSIPKNVTAAQLPGALIPPNLRVCSIAASLFRRSGSACFRETSLPQSPSFTASLARVALVVSATLGLFAPPAFAQSGGVRLSPPAPRGVTLSAQSEAMMLSAARPMALTIDPANPPAVSPSAARVEDSGEMRVAPGYAGRPVVSMVDEAEYRALTDAAQAALSGAPAISEQNYGVGLEDTPYHYNDYLQFPSPYYAPYRSVGRLVFTASDGVTYWCTATLIARAIIVTAGHCVFDGGANDESGFNLDGYFYPGYSAVDGDSQRYGRCRILRWGTTDAWFTTGELNGGYDVGVALCDRLEDARWTYVNGRLPGYALGYMGFCYENCRPSYWFLTQLGYPGNYYGGGEMTVSQHLAITRQEIPNLPGSTGLDFIVGSGMQGGSSGGPHVSNIGDISDSSADQGQYTTRNMVMGVTSWGFIGLQYKIQGASPLSGVNNANDFVGLFNAICRASRRIHGSYSCTRL